MVKTALILTFIWALLFSTLGTVQFARFASAQVNGPIIITADGEVEPSTAPIQRVGDVYTLTNDIGVVNYDYSTIGINVFKDNIVIDGANFSLYAKYTNDADGNHHTGVDLGLRDNVEVRNLEIRGFEHGISFRGLLYANEGDTHAYCDNITIAKNNITNCKYGIKTDVCCRNLTICENYLSKNSYGLQLAMTSESLISGNYFAENRFGANVVLSGGNRIIENEFVENTEGAVRLSEARNNTFCHNNFINNSLFGSCQISNPWIGSVGEDNIWDNGSIGNYWNDFNKRFPNASKIFRKGVWNTPYFINEENIDQYPLIAPYGTAPPEIGVLSPANNTVYNSSTVSLNVTVNRQAVWFGYSLDGQENVTITGNTTLSELSNGLHNIAVYARDEFENTVVSETISFNVDVPFPITLIIAAFGVSVAVVTVALLVYFKKRKSEAKPS